MIELAEEIINGKRLQSMEECESLDAYTTEELCEAANVVREALCGNQVDLCTIINGRSGHCSENCKFCAQSAHYHTGAEVYDFLSEEEILSDCKRHEESGVQGYSIVTAGRALSDADVEKECAIVRRLKKETGLRICASNGLLSEEALKKLKAAGVTNYHCNIETAESNFSNICTTHSFEDKKKEIEAAKRAGLTVCSGGIIGMGETRKQRYEMALSLAKMEITSIPINILIPIPGTALADAEPLTQEEIERTVAIFRLINPTAYIRMAGGRKYVSNGGESLFRAGANAAITGDMLTTVGNQTKQDQEMLSKLGFVWE